MRIALEVWRALLALGVSTTLLSCGAGVDGPSDDEAASPIHAQDGIQKKLSALQSFSCGNTAGLQAGSPWPMRGGCPSRAGVSDLSGGETNQVNWSTALASASRTSPAVMADGTIVTASDNGRVYAIRPDGTIRWTRNIGSVIWSSPAIGSDGTIYIGSHSNRLYALKPTDGSDRWTFNTGADISASPVIGGDGTIYVGSEDDKLYAVNPNGTQRWAYDTGNDVKSSASIGTDGTIYVGSDSEYVFAIRADGTLKWRSPDLQGDVRSSPALTGDRLYIGSEENKLHALRLSDGQIIWEKSFPSSDVKGSAAVAPDGTVYVGTEDGKLYALRADGTVRWSYSTGDDVLSSPIIDSEGNIYFGSDDNSVYALRPDGTLRWKRQTGDDVRSSPAIGAGGEILVGSNDGHLYSIGKAEQGKDSDCDGITDSRELSAGLNPASPADGDADPDNDGIESQLELVLGGNPNAADTDGDGVLDDPDIFNDTDLDGDGVRFAIDNCQKIGNPRQEDADSDGVGDLCDDIDGSSGASAPVSVVKDPMGRFAVWRTDIQEVGRLQKDQAGLIPTGTTFRVFDGPFVGSREIIELWNPTLVRHAYAGSSAEEQALRAQGYRVMGSIGYVPTSMPALGEPVALQHLRHPTFGDALTTSTAEASALTTAGYQALPSLGFALKDYGELHKPAPVARFRQVSSGRVVHSPASLNEQGLADAQAEGYSFSLFSAPTGWTVPLRRLRNAAGDELLSANASETFSGYSVEGVLGYAYPASGSVNTTQNLITLYRLTASNGRHEHRASLVEAQALVAQGYAMQAIARVVAVPRQLVASTSCAGAPGAAQRVDDQLAGFTPEHKAGAVLYRLTSACHMLRALDGLAVTPSEITYAKIFENVNPQVRADARAYAQELLALSPAERAARLGAFAYLDPGNCAQTADEARIGTILQALFEPVSDTGGSEPRSLARLRAPQCEGAPYAPGVPGEADGARAVVSVDEVTICGGEFCQPTTDLTKPTVHGVKIGGQVPAGSPAEQYKAVHPDVGFPVKGIDVNACTVSCSSTLGQRCVANRCMQFPIVPQNTTPVFAVSNAWDTITPELEFQELNPATGALVGDPIRRKARVGIDRIQPSNDSPALRCDPEPVGSPTMADPAEARIEEVGTADTPLLDANKFYKVRAVNKNGSYYRIGDVKSLDPTKWVETARTVHVCAPPGCDPQPTPENAACELTTLPSCGAPVGVQWLVPPRSLAQCRAADPLGTANGCPETPLEFASSEANESTIYVSEPNPTFQVQTTLAGIHCNNETGRTNRPNVNPDEVTVAFFGLATGIRDTKDLEDLDRFGVVRMDMNNGDKRRKRQVIGMMPITIDGISTSVVSVGEDDVYSFQIWWRSHLIGNAAAVLAGLAGAGPWGAAGAGFGAEVTAATAMSLADKPDPDDVIGRAATQQTMFDVQQRGALGHDADVSNQVPTLKQLGTLLQRVDNTTAGVHPGVDLTAYANNNVQSCANDSACGNKVCHLGACVPSNWTDPTLPVEYDAAVDVAGTIERWDMSGSRSDYRVYISTSLSTKPPLP